MARLTLPATYQSQLQHIQESPKFKRLPDGTNEAVPFPGYTVVAPPWGEDLENEAFYVHLQELQQLLLQQLDKGLLVPVPPTSFHLTLADLVWDSAYRERQVENPQYDEQLQERVRDSFQKSHQFVTTGNPLGWQLLGLMVMPRALGVCLVPNNEDSYKRLLELRRAIYQNRGLMGLGVDQHYNLTAHITLGYFGEIPPELERDRLSETLTKLSQQALPEEAIPLHIQRAELRKFDNMMRYYRDPDWPVVEF